MSQTEIKATSLNKGVAIVMENIYEQPYLIHSQTISAIIKDWKNDCDYVPSNDARVFFASIDGKPLSPYCYTNFLSLMRYLESMNNTMSAEKSEEEQYKAILFDYQIEMRKKGTPCEILSEKDAVSKIEKRVLSSSDGYWIAISNNQKVIESTCWDWACMKKIITDYQNDLGLTEEEASYVFWKNIEEYNPKEYQRCLNGRALKEALEDGSLDELRNEYLYEENIDTYFVKTYERGSHYVSV